MSQTIISGSIQKTTTPGLAPTIREKYLSKVLLKNAEPALVHAQFGEKAQIPKNNGKKIEFRGFNILPKAKKPLTEGVTPKGSGLTMRTVNATLEQYGDYIAMTDQLSDTAIDPVLQQANEQLGLQAGETLDALVADVINAGTNVQYAGGKTTRAAIVGNLTVEEVRKAVRTLKRYKAKPINGSYVAIVHPDVSYDLQSDTNWLDVKKYSDPKDIYSGETGKLYGVRFVETTEAKAFFGDVLAKSDGAGETPTYAAISVFTIKSIDAENKKVVVEEAISTAQATALAAATVAARGITMAIATATGGAAGAAYITFTDDVPASWQEKLVLYGGGATSAGKPVYSTLVIGADAYGVIDLANGGIKNITKALGSGGTSDPLDQRSTTGWKAYNAAIVLNNEFMVRIESVASNTATIPTN